MWLDNVALRSRRFAVALTLCLPLVTGATLLAAEPEVVAPVPGHDLLDRFEATADGSSVVLRPLDESSAVRTIEIDADGEVRVNGKRFDEAELEGFLGRDGQLIRELAALERDERFETVGLEPQHRRRRHDISDLQIEVPAGIAGRRIHVRRSGDERVSIGRSIKLEKGESASNVVCIGCSVEIEGEDSGDAVAIGGSVRVSGRVEGAAVSIGGSVVVEDGGVVEGDGVSVGGSVRTEGGGEVKGQNVGVGIGGLPWGEGWGVGFPWSAFSDVGRLASAVLRTGLLALLAVVLVLLARPAVDAAARRVAAEPWKAVFAGLLTQLLLGPVLILVIVVLAVSIIGIPLLLLVPFALVAVIVGWFLGFVAVARALGRWAERRFHGSFTSVGLAVIVGVVLIQLASLVGRVLSLPGGVIAAIGFTVVGLGFFLKYLAWTAGLGAVTLLALSGEWRRGRLTAPLPLPPQDDDLEAEAMEAMPPPPPPAPAPSTPPPAPPEESDERG